VQWVRVGGVSVRRGAKTAWQAGQCGRARVYVVMRGVLCGVLEHSGTSGRVGSEVVGAEGYRKPRLRSGISVDEPARHMVRRAGAELKNYAKKRQEVPTITRYERGSGANARERNTRNRYVHVGDAAVRQPN